MYPQQLGQTALFPLRTANGSPVRLAGETIYLLKAGQTCPPGGRLVTVAGRRLCYSKTPPVAVAPPPPPPAPVPIPAPAPLPYFPVPLPPPILVQPIEVLRPREAAPAPRAPPPAPAPATAVQAEEKPSLDWRLIVPLALLTFG